MDFLTPKERILQKVELLNKLRAKSGRSVQELVSKVLSEEQEKLYPYSVEVILFNESNTPEFRTYNFMCKSSAQAIQTVSKILNLQDIEEVDPSNTVNSILTARRIHSTPKKYSEKDLLNSWHYILRHLKHGVILQNGTEIKVSNKGSISKLLSEKYGLRASNYLVELYNKGRYNYNV